ncbi:hypothetical protein LTR53_005433 [Teratosphaeriaceae sp. CCFEE 6253]|nr:hypothetical protein LTR53_005433 [Teratosphaeriaceae sp. CCFEE 6253]
MRLSDRYPTIDGASLRLIPFHAEHIHDYWPLLQEKENVALWRQTYHVEPGSKSSCLANINESLTGCDDIDSTAMWSIMDDWGHGVIGWATLTTASAAPDLARCVLFLARLSRSERGTECIHFLGAILFEELDFQRLDFRAGTLVESRGPGGGWQGITIIGVLSRQLLDKDRSQESDVYTMSREQWPAIKSAVRAWLESKTRCRERYKDSGCENFFARESV